MLWPLDPGLRSRCAATSTGRVAGTPDNELSPTRSLTRVKPSLT